MKIFPGVVKEKEEEDLKGKYKTDGEQEEFEQHSSKREKGEKCSEVENQEE